MKTLRPLQAVCMVSVLFVATASSAQALKTLYSFSGPDGIDPVAGLKQANDGNLYGTAYKGGAGGLGTVFKITGTGTLTTLHSFDGSDGSYPYASLVQGSDGDLYGTTAGGGARGAGTVFKITTQGTLTTLYSFCPLFICTDGQSPFGWLVEGSDGNFYGTTNLGGAAAQGTVFKITPQGELTSLYSFCSLAGCADGQSPTAGLVQGSDGNFYGTTLLGGTANEGVVFKITPSGTLTTLHSFDYYTDGGSPVGGLMQANDGSFYGTTFYGAPSGVGTVFKITASGTLTTVHVFGWSDGANPEAGLVQGLDGTLYGTTSQGGSHCGPTGCGTLFNMTLGGTLTTLHSFDGGDGQGPYAPLTPAPGNSFYGTTTQGGTNKDGTIFRLVIPRACVHCPTPE